jgi:hypothetical protein
VTIGIKYSEEKLIRNLYALGTATKYAKAPPDKKNNNDKGAKIKTNFFSEGLRAPPYKSPDLINNIR